MARDRAESPLCAAKQVCLRCALHHVLKHWGQTATAVTLLSAATLVNAQAAITAITGQQVNGRDAVRVEFNGATDVVPTSFKMDSPPRIAIDLPGIEAGTIARSVPLAQGNIKSIRLAAAGDRTRLVMELAEAAELRTSRDGNALVVRGKICGAMPMVAKVTPEEARAALKLLDARTILFLLTILFRKS